MQHLFSYGTLRLASVQLAHFGRLLSGKPDGLRHFRIESLAVTDSSVVAVSGTDSHPILRCSPQSSDVVSGTVFELSDDEILAADAYEVSDYERVEVQLESGTSAWVYVEAASAPSSTEV